MRSTFACLVSMGLGVCAVASCGRIGYDRLDLAGAGVSDASPGSASGAVGADGDVSADGSAATGADGSSLDGSGDGPSGAASDSGGFDAQPDTLVEASTIQADASTLDVNVTDPTQTVRTGSAQIGSGELDLTVNSRDNAGAAYLPQPYAITATTSFSVAFSFRLYGAVGQTGDGFAFVWQNDPRGTAALGISPYGAALGYGGITPSVDVEFDVFANTWDPGPDDVAITTNGQYMTAIAHQLAPFNYADGGTYYAWIDYQAGARTISVYLANSASHPATPLVTATVDLFATLGGSAYVGFTGSCGGANEFAAIESLTIQYTP